MEDALAHEVFESDDQMRGVLILVVMEDALAPAETIKTVAVIKVLILVVMEDALAHKQENAWAIIDL